jgi:hypothetical protein
MPELNQSIAHIPLPDRLRARPISSRGFPVPWFITVQDAAGEWDFRTVDPRRVGEAIRTKRCWICGHPLGRNLSFNLGPMCAINRISAEPPSHLVCAEYAVKACPFLSHPRARRNTVDMVEGHVPAPGLMLERNPGVALVWTAEQFHVHAYPEVAAIGARAGYLLEVGEPVAASFWCEGRPATRAEVEASVKSGLPLLEAAARVQGAEAEALLARQVERAAPIFATVPS